MFKSFFRHYFGFNQQQRNGLFVLLGISLLLLAARLVYPVFLGYDDIRLLELPTVTTDTVPPVLPAQRADQPRTQDHHSAFYFDPNTVSSEALQQLGFSAKQAAAFVRFRNKGVVFREAGDLKKSYVVSERLYQRLAPYVRIAPLQPSSKAPSPSAGGPTATVAPVAPAVVDLNSADSAALTELPGVGPVLARRIVRYRELLGGFVNPSQLGEVYGISEDLQQRLQKKVRADTSLVQKLRLNHDEFRRLSRHPYIGFDLAKRLFREKRRKTLAAADLEAMVTDSAGFRRLLPYLRFD